MRAHHAQVELARTHRALGEALSFGLHVRVVESRAVQVRERRHVFRIEQRPRAVFFDPAHEQVRNPVGEVEVVRAAGVIARVVAQFQEGFDVCVPRLEVRARRALAPPALIDRSDRRVERLQPRNDAVRKPVRGTDQRAFRANAVPCDADATGELREQGDILVPVVDAFERIFRRIQQEAARELFVARARIEQRR